MGFVSRLLFVTFLFRLEVYLAGAATSIVYLEAREVPQNLTSPNYPNSYPSDANYSWNIFALYYDAKIHLELVFLDIEYSPGCTSDSLVVYSDYRRRRRLLQLCGNTSSVSNVTAKGDIYVDFKSDKETHGSGFVLRFSMDYTYDDEEYNGRGYIQGWGLAMVISFVVIVTVLTIAVTCVCVYNRRSRLRRQGPYKLDIATELRPHVNANGVAENAI